MGAHKMMVRCMIHDIVFESFKQNNSETICPLCAQKKYDDLLEWVSKRECRASKQKASVTKLIRRLIGIASPCNPQLPELVHHKGNCPENHPHCCGRCATIHEAKRWLKENAKPREGRGRPV